MVTWKNSAECKRLRILKKKKIDRWNLSYKVIKFSWNFGSSCWFFGRFQVGKENGESSYIWEMIWTNECQFKWKVANFPNIWWTSHSPFPFPHLFSESLPHTLKNVLWSHKDLNLSLGSCSLVKCGKMLSSFWPSISSSKLSIAQIMRWLCVKWDQLQRH